MTKQHTTIKNIKNNYRKVFRTGYCDLQDIYKYHNPQFYNAGVYGWNCDIYIDYTRDIAITTGYRNMAGVMIPKELIEKYSDIAKGLYTNWKSWEAPFEELQKALEENINNFLNELNNL